MAITTEQVKQLRQTTGAGILDCRNALNDSNGDLDKALIILREKGLAKASKRSGRETSEGMVELYSHGIGRVGVMVEVNCETDFVARSDSFRKFAHEIALQIAAAYPKWIHEEEIPEDLLQEEADIARKQYLDEGKPAKVVERIVEGRINKFKDENCLMRQTYIRDDSISIQDYLNGLIASLGENINIKRFARWEVGELSE